MTVYLTGLGSIVQTAGAETAASEGPRAWGSQIPATRYAKR
jgi:hypothetical protein